jgi:FMN phosphatase YigB (HAD superfamily)
MTTKPEAAVNAPPLRAVLFDLDGTLRHNEPDGYATFICFLEELGHPLAAAQRAHGERWTHYYWSIAPELKEDIEALGADTPEFWRRYSERQILALDLDGDANVLGAQVNQMFTDRYHPVNRVPADVRPTLSRVRAAGYTVGLVSNRTGALDGLVSELGLDGLFHFTLSAGQAGAWKPAPEIFQQAVALANCAPAEAAYVGDNYYADIEGARGAGLRPILYDPRGLFPEPGCLVIHTIGDLLHTDFLTTDETD